MRSVIMRILAAFLAASAAAVPVRGQTPDQHQQHHPDSVMPPKPDGQKSGMMGSMNAPTPRALYPSLMEFPELTAERRADIALLAQERILAGSTLMLSAVDRLTVAARGEDYRAMQDASAQLREGLAGFESGLATRRALAEGRAPRDVALAWFRREMSLPAAELAPARHGLLGLSWFHYITMTLLAAFVTGMLWMYLHKMRRVEALLGDLAAAQAAPRPSSAASGGAPAP